MTNRLPGATGTPKTHRIGIPIKLRRTVDGVELRPRELERLRIQETHLRAVLARAGLAPVPLGYIENGWVQYAAEPATNKVGQYINTEAPIQRKLEALIEEARVARHRSVASAESAERTSGTGGSEITAPEATEATTVTGAVDDAGRDNAAMTADISECAAPPAAPLHDDDREALVADIKRGPDVITIDGRPMQWSKAIMPIDAPDFRPPQTIECTLGQPEHHFLDKHGRRYRIPDSFDLDDLVEGTRVRVDDVRTEHVFATTLHRQRDLVFGVDG